MKLISLNLMNDLARKLYVTLLDTNNNFSLVDEFSTLNAKQCFAKIRHYIDWINQIKVNSVMIISIPSIDSFCLCYALILCNKTYIPVHTSTSSELLEIYLHNYQVDLLWVHPQLAEQFDSQLKNKLIEDKDKAFFYYLPDIQQTFCIMPGMVFFTSGTTDLPKSVHYQYDTIFRYMSWCLSEFNFNNKDNLLFTSELAFIASLRPLFLPALAGANITFIESNSTNKLQLITNALINSKITVLNLTPSFFKLLVHHIQKTQTLSCLLPIRLVLLSGELIDVDVINHWFSEINPNTVFYNLYGSTECLLPFYKKIQATLEEKDRLHLGQLRPGCDYKLLPDANKGYELCIAGDLSTAYFDEKLTQNNYIIINNSRYIKTNDFVKIEEIDKNKELFFYSRSQRLIKRYGQLINLDQIEYLLKQCFHDFDFIAFSDEENENQIYLIVHKSLYDADLLQRIKLSLKTHLPSYMHPKQYIFTQEIPLTSSGKINYFLIKKQFIQKHIEEIPDYFKRFFHDKPINTNMKIVDLGLESIDYLEMAEEFLKITGKWLDVSKINDETRIADINSCLIDLDLEQSDHTNVVRINAIQRNFYSPELDDDYDESVCIVASFCLKGELDIRRLEIAIAQTMANHFILNSKLEWIDSDYFFVNTEMQANFRLRTPLFLSKNDLTKLKTHVHSDRLVRVYIQKIKKQYFLIMSYHHIALDGWSAMLVREEIFRRYEGTHEIKCFNKTDEIDYLNKANEFWLHNAYNLRKLQSRLIYVNPHEYNHLESIFGDIALNKHTCFTLEKNKVDQFARDNQVQDSPYSVIFLLLFHQIISQLAGVYKLFFHVSFSNRNLPIPNIKELITNIATGFFVYLDNKNLTTKEFASQIKDILTIYFKNMGYSGLKEVWENEMISQTYSASRRQRYRLVYTYINKIIDQEYVHNKYIDWNKSMSVFNPKKTKSTGKKKTVFLRVFNMGTHFVVMLNSQMKEKLHECFINNLEELMNIKS